MKIGIVGVGAMGSGIAKAFAVHDGYEVMVADINTEIAQKGLDKINAGFTRAVEKGKMTDQAAAAAWGRITVGDLNELAGCTLVIEAAQEKLAVKKALFAMLAGICATDAIFASNTSSISITEIGQGIKQQVVGMHFFNPADVMRLVEVIPGLHTTRATVEKILAVAADIGKTPVEVRESAGFVVNRMLIPMINEAVGILAEGVACAADIDTAMKLGANHPLGPLALADLIGLDVCLAIMEVLQEESGDPKYRPHPLLRQMVRGGLWGRKSGRGFFEYTA